jgi:hypothetical protein
MISNELWSAYCSTAVTFESHSGKKFRINPSIEPGEWPFDSGTVEAYVIGAANPFSDKASDESNQLAHMKLEGALDALSITFLQCEGSSPDGMWIEPSLLALNPEKRLIRQLGKEYKQIVIFRWTPLAWECISLVSKQRYTSGCSLSNSIS